MWQLTTRSEEETEAWGERLGRLARPGDFIALTGELGAGKTTFTRGILKGAGAGGFQGSPTFTLVQVYEGRLPVYHFDVYRLGGDAVEELEWIGYEEMFHGDGLTVVEWADQVRELWPEEYLHVALAWSPDHPGERHLTLNAAGARHGALLEELKALC